MNCEELFNKIDELHPFYVKVLEDVCNIESPTTYKEGVDKVCQYFVDMAEKRGWDVEIFKHDIAGNAACITLNPDAKGKPVCLSGHMDTVQPLGICGYPPVKIEDDIMYGPGTTDCKGGCVAAFMAMDALSQIGFADRPIKLILQSDEETSSKQSNKKTIEFMCEKAEGAAAFLNTEGLKPENKNKLVLKRKGILRLKYNITGKAAHSSRCTQGINAIAEAAHKILELEKMKDEDAITFNCGVIEGGTVGNTVPEKCSFILDIRFSNDDEEKTAREFAQKVADTSYLEGTKCIVEEVSYRPSMPVTDTNLALFNRANEIFKEVGLTEREQWYSPGGSDAAYITQKGIPCLDNVGVVGDRIHSHEEFVYISSLKYSAKSMAAVVVNI